jgi:nucleoside-diphosphate-sugar epimerase
MSRATSTADNAIAVTGATGFVGQAVLDAARAQGVPVKALTRREQPPQDGVIWVRGDLQDTGALADLAANTKAMIHVAGLTNTPDPAEFEAANVTGTADVLAACAEAQCKRFVFVSSLSAREPLLSAYGASKAQAETLVEQSALDWTIVRPPAVYGPRDTDMFELFRAAKLGFIPMPPRGATSIIHVMDLARLLLGLVDAGGIAHKQLYEPDDGREGGWAHKELAQAIGAAMGRSVWAPNLPRGMVKLGVAIDRLARGDRAKLTADRASYMCHPNWVARFDRKPPRGLWQPEYSGEVGLAQTAQWYREAGKL